MSDPLVSVVIPTYNRAKRVQRAIQSVLNQTYDNIEVLVVDDASTDNTPKVVNRIEDERVQYIRLEENQGASAARNIGIEAASGDYVGFLDSDDVWEPSKLEQQIEVAARHLEANVIYSGWRWVDEEDGSLLKEHIPDETGKLEGKPRWAFNCIPDLLIEVDLAKNTVFDNSLLSYENFDLLFRLAKKGQFAFTAGVLVTCYEHGAPRNSDKGDYRARVLRQLINEHEDLIRQDRKAWRDLNMTVGASHLRRLKNLPAARNHLVRVVRADPINWKAWMYFMASFVSPKLYPKRVHDVVFRD